MIDGPVYVQRIAAVLIESSVILVVGMAVAVLLLRGLVAVQQALQRRQLRRFRPLVDAALRGDPAALQQLAAIPIRHRLLIGRLLIEPLIDDRDPGRIASTRDIVRALSLIPVADGYLNSRLWWRRALALRAIGLIQATERTAALVAALDDPHPDVRAAALDALTDLRDPASIPAVVVRLHDRSLHRGRCAAALAALGSECEPFLADMASIDETHRFNYARALAICGTARSRPLLAEWTHDRRPDVCAAAFEGLAHVGLDEDAARLAIDALEREEVPVRAMAALALRGWRGPGDGAIRLARLLDDEWPVAVNAARSLRSMGLEGAVVLETCGARPGLAGELARQMLWQQDVRC